MTSVRDDDFVRYVAANRSRLRRAAYLLNGDWSLAEDLVQTTLTNLYLAWPNVHPRSPDAYARKIMMRAFLDERRRFWRREQPHADVPDLEVAAPVATFEDLDLLNRALATLPKRQRATVVLRHWYGLSAQETADAMGCSTGTVKSQTARALTALSQHLATENLPTSGAK